MLVNTQYFHRAFLHPNGGFLARFLRPSTVVTLSISGIRDAYFSPKSWAFLRCFCNQPQGHPRVPGEPSGIMVIVVVGP